MAAVLTSAVHDDHDSTDDHALSGLRGDRSVSQRGTKAADTARLPRAQRTLAGSEDVAAPTRTPLYVYLCAACASLNSMLLGYDMGVSGGAMFLAKEQLGITEVEVEIIIGSLSVAAVGGTALARPVCDNLGRMRTLALASLLFMAGSALMALADGFLALLLGRLLLGLGVGSGLSIDPLYISEIAPASKRGFFVCWSEISINVGIMSGMLSSYLFSFGDPATAWRYMVWVGAVPPIAMMILALFVMPETPRFLFKAGRDADGQAVLRRLCGSEAEARQTAADIVRAQAEEKAEAVQGWSALCPRPAPPLRLMLTVVLGVATLQQACGVTAFMYYTPFLLKQVGFESRSQVLGITAGMGAAKSLTLIATSQLLDHPCAGRRRLLLASFGGMAVSLFALALGAAGDVKFLVVAAVFVYVAWFSIGAGPMSALFAAEILPTSVRARGMMLATGSNRVMSSIISLSFLSFTGQSAPAAFLFFAAVCVFAVWFVYTKCPETQGHSLEDMYELFTAAARAQAHTRGCCAGAGVGAGVNAPATGPVPCMPCCCAPAAAGSAGGGGARLKQAPASVSVPVKVGAGAGHVALPRSGGTGVASASRSGRGGVPGADVELSASGGGGGGVGPGDVELQQLHDHRGSQAHAH